MKLKGTCVTQASEYNVRLQHRYVIHTYIPMSLQLINVVPVQWPSDRRHKQISIPASKSTPNSGRGGGGEAQFSVIVND